MAATSNFLGEHQLTINQDGQLSLPKQLRPAMETAMVITRGFERNLLLMPLERWQQLAGQVAEQPMSNSDVRQFRRRFFSAAIEVPPLTGDQLNISTSLMQFADLDNEVVLVGMYDYFEIWPSAVWQEMRASFTDVAADQWESIEI